jgi:MFS family permease
VSPLRERSFRRIWAAGLISDTGDWLLLVSLPILVYRDTGSALGTSIAFLVELIPPVLLGPIAGSMADRFDRRRTLMLVSAAQAMALTPLLLVHGRSGLPIIYLVVVAQAALATVFEPTKNALLPTLVKPDRLVSANSLVGLNQNLGRLIGGSLGGVLLAVGGGLPAIVIADLSSFLIAAALIYGSATVDPAASPARDRAQQKQVDAGWSATLADRRVRGGLAVLVTASVAQGMFVVLSIVFVVRVLHGGSGEIGLLRGVQAIGAIVAGLALSGVTRVGAGALTTWAAASFGLLDLSIWNAPHLTHAEPLFVALFIVVGAPGLALLTGLTSAIQQVTQEGQRGKVFAAMGVAAAVGQAVGVLLAGLLGDSLGVVTVLDVQGLLYLVAGAIAARWLVVAPVNAHTLEQHRRRPAASLKARAALQLKR